MSRIYEDLDMIRKRPGMYLGALSVSKMHTFLDGYRFAIREEAEQVVRIPFQPLPFWLFGTFVARKYQESACMGWNRIILEQVQGDEKKGLELFFELLDEFRGIKMSTCFMAELSAENVIYHSTSEKTPKYCGGALGEQRIPEYLDAKKIYKMELDKNRGFVLVVEYEEVFCVGGIYVAFVEDIFFNEEQLDAYVKSCFGNVLWEVEFEYSMNPKPIVRRRYVKEDGTVGYWFI